MPELPEVETTVRGLQPHVEHAVIQRMIIRQAKLRWPILPELPQLVEQQSIQQLTRRGKYILMHCTRGTLILHLGMSGRLCLFSQPPLPGPHDHVDIILSSQWCLRYTDPRRFGAILWTTSPLNQHPLLQKLGVEPLSSAFTPQYLYQQLHSRRTTIKTLLMNAHIVVGIGNIYANEALYLARVHPELPGCELTQQQAEQLVLAIQTVLTTAIAAGGTTLKDFVDSTGKPGYFAQQLQVYGRGGLPCKRCNQPLQKRMLAQRQTVFCPCCQEIIRS